MFQTKLFTVGDKLSIDRLYNQSIKETILNANGTSINHTFTFDKICRLCH